MIATAERLRLIKAVHTLAWAFFATCIVAFPPLAWSGQFDLALLFIGIVTVEVAIVAVNAWRCPLTAVAARYTEDRRPNFDIFLPEWLARYNKEIFGPLFGIGVLLTLTLWLWR